MVKRRKVALIYEYDENWIGGTYYLQNLVSSITHVSDQEKPELIVFCNKKEHYDKLAEVTGYPYISYKNSVIQYNVIERVVNKLSRVFFNKNLIEKYHRGIDLIFPVRHEEHLVSFPNAKKYLYWIPDLQEYFLPEFFTKEEIEVRKKYQGVIVEKAKNIVFSSESAKKGFNEIYPNNKIEQYVLPFAVTHPKGGEKRIKDVLAQFNIDTKYFICSNQFWKHKNHSVILRAIHHLKQQGHECLVVFTGKEFDYRNPTYFEELLGLVGELEIKDNVKFLGFISREDQLALMKYSEAVIQPSLFEGWSTVVEDAKALNVSIVASSIDVHEEQLQTYEKKYLFNPANYTELALLMVDAMSNKKQSNSVMYNYSRDIINFSNNFMKVVDSIFKQEADLVKR